MGRLEPKAAGARPTVTACRHIGLTANGSALIVQLWEGKSPRLKVSKAITVAEVEGWLRDEMIHRSSETVRTVVDALNIMRTTVYSSEALSFDPQAKVEAAIKLLIEGLPVLIEIGQESEQAAAAQGLLPSIARHRAGYEANIRLMSALVSAKNAFVPSQPGRRGGALWQGDALWLVFLLRQEETEGHLPLSFVSSNGPGTRFVHTALRQALRLNVTVQAVGQAVAKFAKLAVLASRVERHPAANTGPRQS